MLFEKNDRCLTQLGGKNFIGNGKSETLTISIVSLAPKKYVPSDLERQPGEAGAFGNFRFNSTRYFDTFTPLFQETFGAQYKYNGNERNLLFIYCTFWYREDFKPYFFQISLPRRLMDDFSEMEEKLFLLCEKIMKADIRPLVDIQGNVANFKGSNFQINLGGLYQSANGKRPARGSSTVNE